VAYVEDDDELMLVTQQGKIIRMVASDIRPIGRQTQGVRLIEIGKPDSVVAVARLVEKNTDGNGEPNAGVSASGVSADTQ
jgi:DNA gyrase subunit A